MSDSLRDPNAYSVLMTGITKRFPGVVANHEVSLAVRTGTFHAVIGENGAGKSTLLNILYGRYRPDEGQVWVEGNEVTHTLHDPADAIRLGIGLVSQHYALIPALTVLENVMLGAENAGPGGMLRPRQAAERVAELAKQLGLFKSNQHIDLNHRADRLSVAAQQKIEILKALYRGARILLLDEPTATLAPQEVESLFALLHTLVDGGTTILFVTHKLRDVMAHSSEVTILRAGELQGCYPISQVTEADLLRLMIGKRRQETVEPDLSSSDVSNSDLSVSRNPATPDVSSSDVSSSDLSVSEKIAKNESDARSQSPTPLISPVIPLLQVRAVTVRNRRGGNAVQDLSLSVARGEIVGIAGVDGSGQRELSEAIVGLRRVDSGQILFEAEVGNEDIVRWSVRQRQAAGIAYIPEDRHRAGMILDFSIAENYLLGHEQNPLWGGGLLLDRDTLLSRTQLMVQRYDVRGGTLADWPQVVPCLEAISRRWYSPVRWTVTHASWLPVSPRVVWM